MKLALIGYGKMGRAIEQIALQRRHEIVSVIDINNLSDFESDKFKSAEVAIEFTRPETAYQNYLKCFENSIPVVSGTTGWLDKLDEIKALCSKNCGFFYASNFSVGVNIFFAVNKYLAKIMDGFNQYEVSMEEVHHIHKLDAPSGTGISLAEDIIAEMDRKTNWVNEVPTNDSELFIKSVRRGEVPGIHEVTYESDVDEIKIYHSAKSRTGFALGAVLAAEYMVGRTGFHNMKDLLKL